MQSQCKTKFKDIKALWIGGCIIALLIVGSIFVYYKYKVHNNEKAIMDSHGLEMIMTYEAYQDKIQQGQTFIVYIGRYTCPYCKVISPVLEKEKERIDSQIPFYYFNVINYKQAILDKEEGAEARWDNIKEAIGFKYIPCVLYYKQGKLESGFFEFVGKEYFEIEDEKEKVKLVEEATLNLEEWLKECGIYK